MANIVYLDSSQMGGGSGGAWDETSVGFLGVQLPGTAGYKFYQSVDKAKDFLSGSVETVSGTAKGAFDIMAFIKDNWKLLSVGAVALIVLLKD